MDRLLPFRVLSYQYADDHGVRISGVGIAEIVSRQEGQSVASYKPELEKRGPEGIPSLDDIEPGKICGAVIPMSERAQTQMRDSIEVIDYLLNQERVVWS
jgi:hypothetical protein